MPGSVLPESLVSVRQGADGTGAVSSGALIQSKRLRIFVVGLHVLYCELSGGRSGCKESASDLQCKARVTYSHLTSSSARRAYDPYLIKQTSAVSVTNILFATRAGPARKFLRTPYVLYKDIIILDREESQELDIFLFGFEIVFPKYLGLGRSTQVIC